MSTKKKNPTSKEHTSWVLFYPAPDVRGEWLGHVLDLNIMSQGRSLEHVIAMTLEATSLAIQWDLEAGKDPFVVRKRARPSEYAKARRALLEGRPIASSDAKKIKSADLVVGVFVLHVKKHSAAIAASSGVVVDQAAA